MLDFPQFNESLPQLGSSNISSSINSNNINNSIINQLNEFGYNPLYSKRIFLYYHPQNIEDALNYLLF